VAKKINFIDLGLLGGLLKPNLAVGFQNFIGLGFLKNLLKLGIWVLNYPLKIHKLGILTIEIMAIALLILSPFNIFMSGVTLLQLELSVLRLRDLVSVLGRC